ncbi:TetR/AcrR family transcriptional regulator [Cohnella silvisoli]|uniref:TetR family transcriptional regulator n=1 Tax=Cohnella silvisoli TaxID=2873699 RepID=A0ABV1KZ94_9BACL|nr:TetR family transcriptional regulator [Cohnella silvisoli]MCD9024685.1 TetR family transcriptional regulator [Cohnella silvisoli]
METESLDEVKTSVQARILNAAEDIFARIGFAGSRMNEIAVKAGVNQALIHYYFESKEKLYMDVVTRLFKQWEFHVNDILLENEAPQALLRKYIKEHFELKCKLPNLYKIYHRESLEGGNLFSKYASTKWTKDTEEKSQILASWKRAGIIQEQMHEQVLLHLIWGMMNQFYYRSAEDMREELKLQGTYEELKDILADQIIRLTLYGVLPREDASRRGTAEERANDIAAKRVYVLLPTEVRSQGKSEIEELLDGLRIIHGMELQILEREDELLDVLSKVCPRLIVVCTTTKFGEIPSATHELLVKLENHSSLIAGRFVAVWTVRDKPAGEALQRTLEEALNRLGAYAVARVPGQSSRDYAGRCAKLVEI